MEKFTGPNGEIRAITTILYMIDGKGFKAVFSGQKEIAKNMVITEVENINETVAMHSAFYGDRKVPTLRKNPNAGQPVIVTGKYAIKN